MSPIRLILLLAPLLACGRSPGGESTDASSSGSGGTLGMGETSATPSDPTTPGVTTGGDPSVPTLPGTISTTEITTVVETDFTTGLPPTSTTFEPGTTTESVDTTTLGSMTDPEPCNDAPGQPQDAVCMDPSGCGCASNRCFIIPILGGLCGECLDDADCVGGGCTRANPLKGAGAVCNLGEAGGGCTSDAACAPNSPNCGVVLDIPGIITVETCGQCADDADCPANAPHCSPDYALPDFGGVLVCAANGGRPNDAGCSLSGSGDKACKSGHCAPALVQGVLELGVCSACSSDADCTMNEICTEARADLGTGQLFGSICAPATCGNGVQDGNESGVDCGGVCGPCVP